jgi:hypothetical protein
MTEQEWLTCASPETMLEFLAPPGVIIYHPSYPPRFSHQSMPGFPSGYPSERKFRLFAVACCRRIWHLITDKRCQEAVGVAERYADGLATVSQLAAAKLSAWEPITASLADEGNLAALHAAWNATWPSAFGAAYGADYYASNYIPKAEESDLLRHVVGNPFRSLTLQSKLLTPTAKQLADSIYNDRDFSRIPILADALSDAGCNNADILNHLRQPGVHVRGCWCLDLILGKE